jgi:hypothetical protein
MPAIEGVLLIPRLEGTYSIALRTNWTAYPFVQAVNLTVVPAQHRSLVINPGNVGKFDLSLAYQGSGERECHAGIAFYAI